MDLNEMAHLHAAGAITRHVSPFDNLKSYNGPQLIKKVQDEITQEITLKLLGDFNWRTRLVGAYFTAVKNYTEFIDIIGTHLLKSELCCVGHIYVLTLAYFNTDKCVQYLNDYLSYYLTKPQLYFDQRYVMQATSYLDKINGTDNSSKYLEYWFALQKLWGKPDEPLSTQYFDDQIEVLKELSKA